MKCPHCNTGLTEAFMRAQVAFSGRVESREGRTLAPEVIWRSAYQRCSECHEAIIYLERYSSVHEQRPNLSMLAYPAAKSRAVPSEVGDPYRQDFVEACKVAQDSPKASA